jgi:ABC-2 type transport system ATP-binding protein
LINLQQASSNLQHIKVIFKENVDQEMLSTLQHTEEIEVLSSESGHLENNGFIIKTLNVELLRKQLLELSLKNNWNIVSLQSESNSLEEIFRQSTQKK